MNGDYTYEKLFVSDTVFNPAEKDFLIKLGALMTAGSNLNFDSSISSGYTYFGQFIAHDIARNDPRNFPRSPVSSPVYNRVSPFFDLNCLYGAGLAPAENSRTLLRLGMTTGEGTGGVTREFPYDLPRRADLSPIIPEDRNDDTLTVAQIHVAFIKFHNAVVKALGDDNRDETFAAARRLVTLHYQWIVLKDFLPKIVKPETLKNVIENGCLFYRPAPEKPFLAHEFAAAAFRVGHSMARNSYEWNRVLCSKGGRGKAELFHFAQFTGRGGLGRKKTLASFWIIDWTRFFDFSPLDLPRPADFNFAKKINAVVSPQLKYIIPKKLAPAAPPLEDYQRSLVNWDLLRGHALELPSGQSVARQMREKNPPEKIEIVPADFIAAKMPAELAERFAAKTPLWYYLLKEAEYQQAGEKLGDVGSRLVAETFIGLLRADPHSILNREWRPQFSPENRRESFGMIDLLKFIADRNQDFNELNALE